MSTHTSDQKELLRKNELFRIFNECLNEIYIFDRKSLYFIEANATACINIGYSIEELRNLSIIDISPKHNSEAFFDLSDPLDEEKNNKIIFETIHLRKNKTSYPVEVHLQSSTYMGRSVFIAITVDISKRQEAEVAKSKIEEQMQHAQKLRSLGVLAGGIAHDFNNILTAILGYSDLIKSSLPTNSKEAEYIEQVIVSARGAAELIQQMLAYAGQGSFSLQPVNLSRLIEDMERLMQISISKKCVLKYELMENIPSVRADPAQLRQIIMNLVMNASDAVGDRSGIIAITTGVMYCEKFYLSETYLNDDLPEGLYSYFEVSDNGQGISREIIPNIFDPFYSTKFTGHGLGLAAVLGIVRGHNAAIKVYSEENKGSTFKVLLPISDEAELKCNAVKNIHPQWKGEGTVLVIDDEESIRAIARIMLEDMGFDVITADDGQEGLYIFKKLHKKINLVLLDMTMPHLDGREVFREIRLIKPEIKTILCSGYNEHSATSQFHGKGLSGFLQKPFQYDDLLKAVKNSFNIQDDST